MIRYSQIYAYRCSNGLHVRFSRFLLGDRVPKYTKCDQFMYIWRPQKGRVKIRCTGRMIRTNATVRDYLLQREACQSSNAVAT